MLIKPPSEISSSDITSEQTYLKRRALIKKGAIAMAAVPAIAHGVDLKVSGEAERFGINDELTPFADASSYNNFYEFGVAKTDPAKHAHRLITSPWNVEVAGLVDKPGTINLEDILRRVDLKERVYRLRCVEAWSMVIPWLGFELRELIALLKPQSGAKYIRFTTLYDPKQMPGQRSATAIIDWPYVEGLRMDEAMHPLTLMAVGMYGKVLPNQNGAPLRLVIPWKYGFKSIKSIVKIEFLAEQPVTSWQSWAPHEYGFYANVNPDVSHPRWSQKYERRLPNTLFNPNRRKTELFNGYGEQVAGLYKGLDLKRHI